MSDPQSNNAFELHDGPALAWAQRAALVIILGLIGVVIWSVTASIDEIAKARGEVEPISQVRPVESQNGGKIALISVTLGQYVEKGDILVTFTETQAKASRDAAVAKLAGIQLQIERLEAQISGRQPDFSRWSGQFPHLVAREHAALKARLAFLDAENMEIGARIEAKNAEIASLDARRPELQKEIDITEEQLEATSQLVARGLSVKAKEVELIERTAQYRFRFAELAGRRTMADAQLAELNATLTRMSLDEVAKSRARVAESLAEVRGLEFEIEALNQRLSDVAIYAPISGFVQSLPDETTGDIVDPGGLVATIVPADGGLRFTGRLTPRDIGFVSIGQTVRVKIDSFDFSRYGALTGVVEEISPTTTVDQRGAAFYEVRVALDKTFFRQETDGLVLLPGMTGEADIRTGAKTVFEYAWKPVFTNLDLALSER